jgi:hypothetical protein
MPRTLLLALVVVLSAVAGWGQFRTVTVQNADSNPVPTSIQNTPNVNIANTPTVNATISGTPAVSITGTPSVSVTGTPTVSVSNLPTGAAGLASLLGVLIKNLDEPARQPVHQQLHCTAVVSCSAGDHLVRIYADPGSMVHFMGFENGPAGPGSADYQMQFSGYFVQLP